MSAQIDYAKISKLVAMLGSPNINEADVALRKLRSELGQNGYTFTDLAAMVKPRDRLSQAEMADVLDELFTVKYPRDVWYVCRNGVKEGNTRALTLEEAYRAIEAPPWYCVERERICFKRFAAVSADRKLDEFTGESVKPDHDGWLAAHIKFQIDRRQNYDTKTPGQRRRMYPKGYVCCGCPDCVAHGLVRQDDHRTYGR